MYVIGQELEVGFKEYTQYFTVDVKGIDEDTVVDAFKKVGEVLYVKEVDGDNEVGKSLAKDAKLSTYLK